MKPQFLYFDLGNVLLRFSHERQAEQMGRVAGVPASRVYSLLYEEGLHWDYERGSFAEAEFYKHFCDRCEVTPDLAQLDQASNDIFELNVPLVALIGHLAGAGCRMGILSNTTDSHWRYCRKRYGALALFRVYAMSFNLRAMKPEPEIYAGASKLAGALPGQIFFTDDRPEHVAGARAAGWDAVPYESVSQINEELRRRGIVINY